jgi:hypothetical protein
LESTGTQYINTGIAPTNTTGLLITCTVPASNSRDNIAVGCRQGGGDSRFWIDLDWTESTLGWGFNMYSDRRSRYSIAGMAGQVLDIGLNYQNDRAGTVGGVVVDDFSNRGNLAVTTRPIYLFAGNNQGSAGVYYTGRVYRLVITDGTSVIQDLIPVLDWSDVPCMYDRVSGALYYNAGTGSFSYGADV